MNTKLIVTLILMAMSVCACKKDEAATAAAVEKIKSGAKPAYEVVQVKRERGLKATQVDQSTVLTTDPSFVALSSEEAHWLEKNGFLTREQLRALQELGEEELRKRSQNRDAAAATALGMLSLRNGNTNRAVLILDAAARMGSLYAIEQLAFAELLDAQNVAGPRDLSSHEAARVQFVARMEQARIMGDHRVDYYINQVADGFDRQRFGDQILRQTTEFMRQMISDSATRGVPARAPSARPNIDLWRRIESQRSGTISAIIR